MVILEEIYGCCWVAYHDEESGSWDAFVIPNHGYTYDKLKEIAKEIYDYRKKLDDERLQRFEAFKKTIADRKAGLSL